MSAFSRRPSAATDRVGLHPTPVGQGLNQLMGILRAELADFVNQR